MAKPVVLLDLDEVLFPWATSYRDFRARRGLPPIPAPAWMAYTVGEATLPGHQALMPEFHCDPFVIQTPPIPGRATDCRRLATRFALVACTSRYEATEGSGTHAWVERWAPWLDEVRFCNWHPETGRTSGKSQVAADLAALALVDDHPVHLTGLPEGTTGYLVARPAGIPSARGALPWASIVAHLMRAHY